MLLEWSRYFFSWLSIISLVFIQITDVAEIFIRFLWQWSLFSLNFDFRERKLFLNLLQLIVFFENLALVNAFIPSIIWSSNIGSVFLFGNIHVFKNIRVQVIRILVELRRLLIKRYLRRRYLSQKVIILFMIIIFMNKSAQSWGWRRQSYDFWRFIHWFDFDILISPWLHLLLRRSNTIKLLWNHPTAL